MARVIIECDLFRYRVFICETKPIKSNKVQGSPVFIDGESHAHPDKLAYRDKNIKKKIHSVMAYSTVMGINRALFFKR